MYAAATIIPNTNIASTNILLLLIYNPLVELMGIAPMS